MESFPISIRASEGVFNQQGRQQRHWTTTTTTRQPDHCLLVQDTYHEQIDGGEETEKEEGKVEEVKDVS
ncbi:GL19827 [Drosophila persimilis]|uniref:GL19827 n=1 Tax=Drosophila persimilis TaxID=7234 RepID=B4GYC5_DROPE|nr:GL19827 [Drosophila persimilis]